MRTYTITQEQLEIIDHYKRMFEIEADNIQQIGNSDDSKMEIGFALGQSHSHLRECFVNMMNLHSDIRNQEIVENTVDDKEEAFDNLSEYGSPEAIGSKHWFNTLMTKCKHIGEFLQNHGTGTQEEYSTLVKNYGKTLYGVGSDVIQYFEKHNSLKDGNNRE